MPYDYKLLHIARDAAALWATIDAPPINVMVVPLYQELAAFATEVAADESVLAVVLQSADPDFFIAHFDVEALIATPMGRGPQRFPELGAYHRMCETFRTMPKAT